MKGWIRFERVDPDGNVEAVQEANERASLLAQDVDEQHAKQEHEARLKIQ